MRAIAKGLLRTKTAFTPIVFLIGFDGSFERKFLYYVRFIHAVKITQRILTTPNEI